MFFWRDFHALSEESSIVESLDIQNESDVQRFIHRCLSADITGQGKVHEEWVFQHQQIMV